MTTDPKSYMNPGFGAYHPDVVVVGPNGTKSTKSIPPCPKCEDRSRVEEITTNVDGKAVSAWICGRCGARWGADGVPVEAQPTDYK